MNNEIFRLLVKKISNEITDEENTFISDIIKNDTEISTEYKRLKIIWKDTGNLKQSSDSQANFERTNKKIFIINKKKRKNTIKTYFQYAAVLAIFFISFIFLFTHTKTILLTNNSDVKKNFTLPDSSTVILAANSYISYEKGIFSDFNREIKFSGKAYFDITKNPDKRFIIHADNFDIKVFGTKFNLDLQNQKETVVLVEGKILVNNFTSNKDTNIIMEPGNLVEYNTKTGEIILNPINPKIYTYWLEDKIIFDNFTIDDLIEVLRIHYGKILVFSDTTLENKKIGGSAPSDDFSLIIEAISLITNKEVIVEKDTFYFK